jgi:hypothetical protein
MPCGRSQNDAAKKFLSLKINDISVRLGGKYLILRSPSKVEFRSMIYLCNVDSFGKQMAETSFASWRRAVGYSIDQAAHSLGLSRSTVCHLLRGYDGAGRPVAPRVDTRLLMQAIADGITLRPYPLAPAELAVIREARARRIRAGQRRDEAA